jgi:molecular chaperone DnaK
VWLSSDGWDWTRVESPALQAAGKQTMESVAAFDGGLVAVGSAYPDAAVWLSSDGRDWTRVKSGSFAGGHMFAIAVFDGGLVAVGHDSSGGDIDAAVWLSTDGWDWSRVGSAAFDGTGIQEMLSVAVFDGGLAAVGDDSSEDREDWDAAVWLSSNGWDWTRVESPALRAAGNQTMESVVAFDGGLVAVGDDAGADSNGGTVWVSPGVGGG